MKLPKLHLCYFSHDNRAIVWNDHSGLTILFHKLIIFSKNFIMFIHLWVKNQTWHRDNDLSLPNMWAFRMDQWTDGAWIIERHLYSGIWQLLCIGWDPNWDGDLKQNKTLLLPQPLLNLQRSGGWGTCHWGTAPPGGRGWVPSLCLSSHEMS